MNLQIALDRTRAIVADIVAPRAEETDREARWPAEAIRALQAAGLGGLVVPGKFGGAGHGTLALARICEIIGAHCPSTALCYGMHCVGSSVISTNPSDDQRQRFLDPICDGQHLTTLSLSEPGTGVHFYFPQTTMQQHNGDYRLKGTKAFVTNGGQADSYVVSAVSEPADQDIPVFSCLVMPKTTPGIEFGEPWKGLGMRGNSSCSMALKDVTVPRGNLLGKEGDQIWYVFNVIAPNFLMAMAGTYLGVASAAVDEARDHLAKRHYSHSGSQLGEITLIQHRLGCLWAKVERTRQLIYSAAARYDAGDQGALAAVMSAKAEVAGCAVDVVNDVMTLEGGIAYRDGSRLHRMLRDARAAHLMSPTTDLLRVWVGRSLLGQPLLGD